MIMPTDAKEWTSQARRGTLEMCVLTLISYKPRYGYELVAALGQWEELTTSEGTLYPLLRRLRQEAYITSEWQESLSGPPRKYYNLTTAGESLLSVMTSEWEGLTWAVKELQQTRDGASKILDK